LRGRWPSFASRCSVGAVRRSTVVGASLSFASLLGGGWRLLGAGRLVDAGRLLGAGRRCPRACRCRVVWAAGSRVVVDAGDVDVWLLRLYVRRLGGCRRL